MLVCQGCTSIRGFFAVHVREAGFSGICWSKHCQHTKSFCVWEFHDINTLSPKLSEAFFLKWLKELLRFWNAVANGQSNRTLLQSCHSVYLKSWTLLEWLWHLLIYLIKSRGVGKWRILSVGSEEKRTSFFEMQKVFQ